jgi:hypothetical protein
MNKTFASAIFISLFTSAQCWASSSLPECPSTGVKHNCWGSATSIDGEKYVGEFRSGKQHGKGTQTAPATGLKFEGNFNEGQFISGVVVSLPGSNSAKQGLERIEGRFANGQPDGVMTVYFSNGRRYVGELKNWTRTGIGVAYEKDGRILASGRWDNGVLVEKQTLDTSKFPFASQQSLVESNLQQEGTEVGKPKQPNQISATSQKRGLPPSEILNEIGGLNSMMCLFLAFKFSKVSNREVSAIADATSKIFTQVVHLIPREQQILFSDSASAILRNKSVDDQLTSLIKECAQLAIPQR